MQNPWLAIDVSTNPLARARELRFARERFLEDRAAVARVRQPIADSWQRSTAAGIDGNLRIGTPELDEREAQDRLSEHALGRVAPLIRRSLTGVAREAEHLTVLSDADGLLLSVEGDPGTRMRAADEMGFVAGAQWSEQATGTNAIGTALASKHAVQVFAGEHLSEEMQRWWCAAAPVRDPVSGAVLGTVNLTGPMETVHPYSLALVMSAATTAEAHLSLASRGRELGAGEAIALTAETLGRDHAEVRVDGRELALSQRHSEILVLLAAHPAGMTGEQLAIALYGDFGKPVTARAEVSRLRRLLGPLIQTEPYRLQADVHSDFATVRALLRDGRIADASALYRGPLLPRSEAPGVVDARNELEGWTRRAVMASEDLEALWTWLETSSGEDDIQAWKRFLSSLPHGDGRRGLAAARLERLRPLFDRPQLAAT